MTFNEGSIGQSRLFRNDADTTSLEAGNAHGIYIPIDCTEHSGNCWVTSLVWADRSLWRSSSSCIELWSCSCDPHWQAKYRNSDGEDKTKHQSTLERTFIFVSTLNSGHKNYDKRRRCGMCSLQQTLSFPFGRNASNWYALSHQYRSLMAFTVNAITVDLIKVCIQRPNQTHSWSDGLTGG